MTKKLLIAALALLASLNASAAEVEISPSEVYTQAVQVEKEIELLARHFKAPPPVAAAPLTADLKPRHSWQKAHEIMMKLTILRRKHGLVTISPVAGEPMLNLDAKYPWAHTQRVLTEIRIVKRFLGISAQASPPAPTSGKRPIDVFNKLHQVSLWLDALNGDGFTPSDVYAEALRIDEDVTAILSRLQIGDNAWPPPKKPSGTPADSLVAAFALMAEIQRLQGLAGLELVDFSVFRKREKVVPSDVFNLLGMALAELQILKAKLGLVHTITPAATYQTDKTPADAAQAIGYITNKLRLIKSL